MLMGGWWSDRSCGVEDERRPPAPGPRPRWALWHSPLAAGAHPLHLEGACSSMNGKRPLPGMNPPGGHPHPARVRHNADEPELCRVRGSWCGYARDGAGLKVFRPVPSMFPVGVELRSAVCPCLWGCAELFGPPAVGPFRLATREFCQHLAGLRSGNGWEQGPSWSGMGSSAVPEGAPCVRGGVTQMGFHRTARRTCLQRAVAFGILGCHDFSPPLPALAGHHRVPPVQ